MEEVAKRWTNPFANLLRAFKHWKMLRDPMARNTKGEAVAGQSDMVCFNVKKGLRIAFVL